MTTSTLRTRTDVTYWRLDKFDGDPPDAHTPDKMPVQTIEGGLDRQTLVTASSDPLACAACGRPLTPPTDKAVLMRIDGTTVYVRCASCVAA